VNRPTKFPCQDAGETYFLATEPEFAILVHFSGWTGGERMGVHAVEKCWMIQARQQDGVCKYPMGTESVLLISGKPDWWSRFSVESLGLAMCKYAAQQGGKAWAGWLQSGAHAVSW
jgi:hypothetical protein